MGGTERCNLCLDEKRFIMKADKQSLLNKRLEIVLTCRHKNRFHINSLKNRRNAWNVLMPASMHLCKPLTNFSQSPEDPVQGETNSSEDQR